MDTAVKDWAADNYVHAESFQASLLHEPWTVRTGAGGPYRVFTPFWRALSAQDFRGPLDAPAKADGPPSGLPPGDDLESWNLLPTKPDWSAGLAEAWTPGEAAGLSALEDFLAGPVQDYDDGRDRPAKPGTSRLSPYLRWGHVSPFQIWHALAGVRGKGPGPDVFGTEIGWREFCWHQLFHNPDLATRNLRPAFDSFPWERPEGAGPRTPPVLRRSQNLGIHWRVGEEWFWETLVDADPASNPANWQWVAGSGADAAPFFRIFNPQTQAKRFDPDGDYGVGGRWRSPAAWTRVRIRVIAIKLAYTAANAPCCPSGANRAGLRLAGHHQLRPMEAWMSQDLSPSRTGGRQLPARTDVEAALIIALLPLMVGLVGIGA
ncbi:MAG: FAD-binding domain-containing protein [Arthrobacter sp.]